MFELSANLELMFTEAGVDAGARCRAAAEQGIKYVEIWDWRNKDLVSLAAALQETGTVLQTMCTIPMGRLVDPSTHEEFLLGLRESIPVAERLGSPFLVVTAGDELTGMGRQDQHNAVVAALRAAVPILEGHEVVLLLENLNSRVDHAGTFLDSTTEVIEILREVDSPQVRLLYDLYHSLVMTEDAATVLRGNLDVLGHIQIADVPGRGEIGTGTIDWAAQLAELRALGYTGRLGMELIPTVETVKSLRAISALAVAV